MIGERGITEMSSSAEEVLILSLSMLKSLQIHGVKC